MPNSIEPALLRQVKSWLEAKYYERVQRVKHVGSFVAPGFEYAKRDPGIVEESRIAASEFHEYLTNLGVSVSAVRSLCIERQWIRPTSPIQVGGVTDWQHGPQFYVVTVNVTLDGHQLATAISEVATRVANLAVLNVDKADKDAEWEKRLLLCGKEIRSLLCVGAFFRNEKLAFGISEQDDDTRCLSYLVNHLRERSSEESGNGDLTMDDIELVVAWLKTERDWMLENHALIDAGVMAAESRKTRCLQLFTKLGSLTETYQKGKAFEEMVQTLFDEPGLEFQEKRVNTGDEEIDLIYRNNVSRPFWHGFKSPIVFVECKNWAEKVGAKEIRDFETKLLNHNANIGFFVAATGFTSEVDNALRRQSRESHHITLVTSDDILAFCRGDMEFYEWIEPLMAKVH